jgi:hypothetical protein
MPWWTIIPFTHLIQFKSGFAYEVVQKPGLTLEADLARAMAIGLGISLLSFLSWAVPFASLLQAFARESHDPAAGRAAWRMALYRSWIVPFGLSLFWLSMWGLPEQTAPMVGELSWLLFQIMPRLLVVLHCHALARFMGASTGGALAVSMVPVAVEGAAALLLGTAVKGLLPPMPEAPP